MQEHFVEVPRSARVLVEGDPRSAKEIWFVLHGYAQLAREMLDACASLAEPERLLVAPEGLSRFYRRGSSGAIGASWMTRDAREAEIADYVRYLDSLASWCERELGARATRHVVLGFSQGAATAWRWATRGTTPIDRWIAWGAGVPPELDLVGLRTKLAGARIELVRGARDALYDAEAFERDRARLASSGLAFEAREFEGGHELAAEELRRLARG